MSDNGPAMIGLMVDPRDLKGLRETLARMSSYAGLFPVDMSSDYHRLNKLINEIDRHRPLGSDGKHGNNHTPSCGCEDTPTPGQTLERKAWDPKLPSTLRIGDSIWRSREQQVCTENPCRDRNCWLKHEKIVEHRDD